ncbi:hypothetical protein PV08_08520 [Exophiala spinifera]|uniref:Serine protease n=1 Tax=Exophiala spinifera TaxID=91928 RepID=A0A0D1ZKH4_9EURO|nr:uncharacterized protein PV08_08520 [Exophiala spinifera]KIW13332.1 hypothetical protein PV08_08520 [Exophiala spinifera]
MANPPQTAIQDIPAENNGPIPKQGIDVLHPFPPVKAVIINAAQPSADAVTPAERLPNFPFKSTPARIPASSIEQTDDEHPNDVAGVVFPPDERHIYHDTNYPFSCIGKVRTAVSTSSGTLVGPRHVLTASHCVNWTRDANGNIGWMSFTPSYYDGRGPWGEFYVTHTLAYKENGRRMTDEQSAWDYAVCVLSEPINTKVGGTIGTKEYSASWNGKPYWISFGYPADLFNAERPEYQNGCVISTTETFGNAQLLGHFNDTFNGQSGGPVWAKWDDQPGPQIVGVVSTSPDVPQTGSTAGDNQYAGGRAMVDLVKQALRDYP